MRDFKDHIKAAGYSQEEAYFHELNRKLIRDFRQKMASEKQARRHERSARANSSHKKAG